MKRSLLVALFTLIGSVLVVSESLSQDFARVAFVNSDRSMILAKTIGGKLDTIFGSGAVTKVRNLSILASTPDSKSLLIGGYFVYPNQSSGLPDSSAIFARLDDPFKNNGGGFNKFTTPPNIAGAKILKIIDQPEANFTKTLPLGCITPDGKEWYGIWDKAQGGNGKVWFYHGNFDGSGGIDSVQLTGSQAPGGGYHMTNMISTLDSKTMLTVVMDQITSDVGRAQLINWTPSIQTFIPIQFDALIHSKQNQSATNPDWAFGFYLHILPLEGNGIVTAELALDVDNSGNLKLYKLRVQNSSILDLSLISGRQLFRSNIPKLDGTDTLHFFTGNTGNPGSDWDDHEVVVPDSGSPMGNGGDLMPSSGGDSIVFVTCAVDNFARAKASGIYIYDLKYGKVYQVQSDETRMERQPIFLASIHKAIPYRVGKAIIDKPSLDLGSVTIGSKSTASVTVTDTTSSLIVLTQAFISGPDAGIFTVAPALSTSNDTLKNHGSLTFTVSFTPTAVKTFTDTLIIHYIDSLKKGEKDSIFAIPLTGTGLKSGGVATSTPSTFDLSVVPNPFTASTNITVTAREASSTSIEIRDLLGKDIYSSRSLRLAEGEKFTYTLDANALHLAPGTYFVIVRSGTEEATRQVIYVK